MQLTKEVLESDKKVYIEQILGLQHRLSYIDGLLAFLDKPEEVKAPAKSRKKGQGGRNAGST